MARAPFDSLMNVYWGPFFSPTPFLVASDRPCRLVRADHIAPAIGTVFGLSGYVTYDPFGIISPSYVEDGLEIRIRWGRGDILEIPAGSGTYYRQIGWDAVSDVATDNYRRSWLAPFAW